jgi:hypothetical protein
VSAVVIAGFAAVCVGVIWYERWQVRREAVRRGWQRRMQQPWRDWAASPRPTDVTTRHLASSLERAVIEADVAWSYRDLYERTRSEHESPFQLRRGRMETSALRYAATLERAVRAARRFIDERPSPGADRHRRDVVERLIDFLEPRTASAGGRDSLQALEVDVDVIETALAHLHDVRIRPPLEDPFRC